MAKKNILGWTYTNEDRENYMASKLLSGRTVKLFGTKYYNAESNPNILIAAGEMNDNDISNIEAWLNNVEDIAELKTEITKIIVPVAQHN